MPRGGFVFAGMRVPGRRPQRRLPLAGRGGQSILAVSWHPV